MYEKSSAVGTLLNVVYVLRVCVCYVVSHRKRERERNAHASTIYAYTCIHLQLAERSRSSGSNTATYVHVHCIYNTTVLCVRVCSWCSPTGKQTTQENISAQILLLCAIAKRRKTMKINENEQAHTVIGVIASGTNTREIYHTECNESTIELRIIIGTNIKANGKMLKRNIGIRRWWINTNTTTVYVYGFRTNVHNRDWLETVWLHLIVLFLLLWSWSDISSNRIIFLKIITVVKHRIHSALIMSLFVCAFISMEERHRDSIRQSLHVFSIMNISCSIGVRFSRHTQAHSDARALSNRSQLRTRFLFPLFWLLHIVAIAYVSSNPNRKYITAAAAAVKTTNN